MTLSANEIDVHVGQRLRSQRESLGISQGQLGRQLGLTFSQVQKYEKGSNRIGAGRLFLLAQYLGVSVQYFYDGLAGMPAASRLRHSDAQSGELGALHGAFLSISDVDTRRSVLSLIRSLADATNLKQPPTKVSAVALNSVPSSFAKTSRRAAE